MLLQPSSLFHVTRDFLNHHPDFTPDDVLWHTRRPQQVLLSSEACARAFDMPVAQFEQWALSVLYDRESNYRFLGEPISLPEYFRLLKEPRS